MDRVPLLLVGDGPAEPTGLGRIARDLAGLMATSDLPIELVQIGGTVPPVFPGPWRTYPLDRTEEWGAGQVQQYYREIFGDRPGVVWVVWDPGRLLPYAQLDLPVSRWTYTAIDAANRHGKIGGPALAALQAFDRVLGYGRWGADILKLSTARPIAYLPHGIWPEVYEAPASPEEQVWVDAALGPYRKRGSILIGCVMTNQFRKDHAIYFGLLRGLLDQGFPVFGWLHTDVSVKAWSIPQLVDDFGLEKHVRVTAYDLTDRQMACLYQACQVVVLPSLGEGFGYPLVEALAAGTPVVHGDCAGGAELVPRTEWRVPVRTTRLEGLYVLQRPVWDVQDWVNAVRRVLEWRQALGPTVVSAYCQGTVAHLHWTALWPRWRSWIRQGLDA